MRLFLPLLIGCSASHQGMGVVEVQPEELAYDSGIETDPNDLDADGFSPEDGDCNDQDAEVHPDAVEVPYDGVDQDCDGGSDYDADLDGYDSEVYGGRDCDDADPHTHPDAEEIFYDAVDGDCAGGDDFDADLDGFALDEDCDDADAAVFPGALEIVGDVVDQDCDGAPDLAPLVFDSFVFQGPRPGRLLATDDHFVLTTAADAFVDGATSHDAVGMSLVFSLDAAAGATPFRTVTWHYNGYTLGPQLDVAPRAGGFTVASTYYRDDSEKTFSVMRDLTWDGAVYEQVMVYDAIDFEHAVDVDLHGTIGAWTVLACSADELLLFRTDGAVLEARVTAKHSGGDSCATDGSTVSISDPTDGVTSYSVDGELSLNDVESVLDGSFSSLDTRDGWTIGSRIASGFDVVTAAESHNRLLPHLSFVSVDAVWDSGELFAAGVIEDSSGDGIPEAVFAYGPPGGLSESVVSSETLGFTPVHVSIAVSESRVMIAVTGEDTLGWTFLAR